MSRSVRIHQFGGPEVMKVEDINVPDPGPGEVRLRVRAIGLNRTEVTFRSGRSTARPIFPTQMGYEAAGEIEALGGGVSGFGIGDRVALIPAYTVSDYGLYAELSLAPARSLVRVPAGTSWEDAAATWMPFATAWAGLIDIAELSAGQSVVINAASSSVGLAAIQLALQVGATPIALTRTSRKVEELKSAGARHVIATSEQDIVAELKAVTNGNGADVIFDSVGGPMFEKLVDATAPGGRIVVYGAFSQEITPLPIMPMLGGRLSIFGFGLPSTTKDDTKLAALRDFVQAGLASGALRPRVARVFPLNEIVAAHHFLEAGDHLGKIVVTP